MRERDNRHLPAVVNLPMEQVGGPQGNPMYVYRPWSEGDIVEAAKHLLKPGEGGAAMAKAIVLPRLLSRVIGSGANHGKSMFA